ncbi:uncharacterized protein LOC120695510 [Panicum virgatum]|uniref:uncharacterized protein LOC120695510 n=1 Tax=Panicum virgatum TaxID=38727 RepID=UPI0019D60422|nr:uncharacterized protein LOC120695510 [Panicum virgatum]
MVCPDPALAGSDPAVLHVAAGDTAVSGAADQPIQKNSSADRLPPPHAALPPAAAAHVHRLPRALHHGAGNPRPVSRRPRAPALYRAPGSKPTKKIPRGRRRVIRREGLRLRLRLRATASNAASGSGSSLQREAALRREEEPPDPLHPSQICLVSRGSVSPSCSQTRRPWPRWPAPAWGPLSAGFLYRCSRTWRRWPVTRQADVASVPRSRAEALANRPWPRWPAPLCCAGGRQHGSPPPPPRPPLAPVLQTVAAFSRHLLIAPDVGPDDHCLRPPSSPLEIVKVGGRNTVLEKASVTNGIPFVSDVPTIVFGADVSHPPAGEESSACIAAVSFLDGVAFEQPKVCYEG